MTKIEKSVEYLFYLLVLLYFVGKVFKPITLIIDILFIYQLVKINDKTHLIVFYEKYKKLIFSFLFFIFYLLFQSAFLEYKYYTFKSSFETILYLILVFAAIYNFDKKEKIEKMIYVSYLILLFLALDSFYQYFTGSDFFGKEMYGNGRRITAWNDMPKVNLMMGQFFGLLIASVFIFSNKKKIFAIFMLIICLTLFIIAGNRSPLLALFPIIFIVGVLSTHRKYIMGLFVIIIGIVMLSLLNPKLEKAYSKFSNLNSSSSTSGRYELFDVGYEMFKSNKLLGIGSHNYKHYFVDYIDKIDKSKYENKNYINSYSKSTPTHVHSVLIDIVVSYGIIGSFIFLYLLYQVYRFFIKGNDLGLLASIGFLYCITPLQFGKSFTQGDWQFITYLGLVFLVIVSKYSDINILNEKGKNNESIV